MSHQHVIGFSLGFRPRLGQLGWANRDEVGAGAVDNGPCCVSVGRCRLLRPKLMSDLWKRFAVEVGDIVKTTIDR